MSSPLERRAVRAVLLTPSAEILLMHLEFPNQRWLWLTPGGGMEPGEDAGLQRQGHNDPVAGHADTVHYAHGRRAGGVWAQSGREESGVLREPLDYLVMEESHGGVV